MEMKAALAKTITALKWPEMAMYGSAEARIFNRNLSEK